MPPAVYAALKTRCLPQLQNLYDYVAVPFEAPEKATYGDLDIVVSVPKSSAEMRSVGVVEGERDPVSVPHATVQKTIGAKYVIPMEGNRTSNFAVPILRGEWKAFNHGKDEDEAWQANEGGELFYQESQKAPHSPPYSSYSL